MNDKIFQYIEQDDKVSLRKTNFFQIDFLKALMIILVIFDHFVSWNIKNEIGVALWERISIPVFLVLLGFNLGHSFRGQGDLSLKQLYSWSYFKKKITRYIIPFLILYLASTFIGLFMYGFDFILMYDTQYYPNHGIINLYYLIMPFWGPGNWFIPVLFQSILIAPLLYWGFTKRPVISLILTFAIEIAMQAIGFFMIGEAFTSWEEVHIFSLLSNSILFYLSAVGLGMWFSFGHKITDKRNRFMWILFPISLAYLIIYQFFDFRLRLDATPLLRGDYNFMVFPYSAFLVLLALQFLPNTSNTRILKTIKLIGKSTYHILLTQILGYGMITAWWGTHYGMDAPFDPSDIIDLIVLWITFIWLGIIWYKIDHQKDLARRILYYLNFFIIFPCFFLLTFWLQGFWVPISLIVVNLYGIAAIIIHFIIKKPINIRVLNLWTGFLVLSFISVILQVEIFLPSDFWIFLIPMGIYLVFALYYTISHKY
ncbi:MAG: acyltransferase [Candidatus Lokiarchaeota archaeon]|nr:acyltransferase [Candidatus Lokiarchaeota archaeon]